MRTAEQIIGKSGTMTVGDLKKILKRIDDNTPIQVPSHFMGGYYSIGRQQVSFDENNIQIGT